MKTYLEIWHLWRVGILLILADENRSVMKKHRKGIPISADALNIVDATETEDANLVCRSSAAINQSAVHFIRELASSKEVTAQEKRRENFLQVLSYRIQH